MDAVLSEDWREAPGDEGLKATLVYLEALTRRPNEVGDRQVDAAIGGGASPGALEQATLMVGLFSYMNRMVDAFGADVTPEEAEVIATRLDALGSGLVGRSKPWERLAGQVPGRLVEQLAIVREGDGDCPAQLRTDIEAFVSARSGADRESPDPLPSAVADLVETLAADAHGVTDGHIEALTVDWSEEAIYEMVFTASFAAGLGRMERSIRLLRDR